MSTLLQRHVEQQNHVWPSTLASGFSHRVSHQSVVWSVLWSCSRENYGFSHAFEWGNWFYCPLFLEKLPKKGTSPWVLVQDHMFATRSYWVVSLDAPYLSHTVLLRLVSNSWAHVILGSPLLSAGTKSARHSALFCGFLTFVYTLRAGTLYV